MEKNLIPKRSYSGLRGCMCGCLGTYTDDPKKMEQALKRVLRNPNTQWDEANQCYYYETKTRNNVVYMKEAYAQTN